VKSVPALCASTAQVTASHEREVANQSSVLWRQIRRRTAVGHSSHHRWSTQLRYRENRRESAPWPEAFNFPFETEGTRPRQQLAEAFLANVHFELLLAKRGMRETTKHFT